MRELQLRTEDAAYIDVVWVRTTKRPMGDSIRTLHSQEESQPGDIVTLRWVAYGALHSVELPDETTREDLKAIGLSVDSGGHYSFTAKAMTSMTYTLLDGVMRSPVAFYSGVSVSLPDLPACQAQTHLGSSLVRIRLRQSTQRAYGS